MLGFDYGRKRIGVAVGQEVTSSASPLITLKTLRDQPQWEQIEALIKEWRPTVLVVGVPRHVDGSSSSSTKDAVGFSRGLAKRYGLQVDTVDERLSSAAAAARLSSKAPRDALDSMSAVLILETWLQEGGKPAQ